MVVSHLLQFCTCLKIDVYFAKVRTSIFYVYD